MIDIIIQKRKISKTIILSMRLKDLKIRGQAEGVLYI